MGRAGAQLPAAPAPMPTTVRALLTVQSPVTDLWLEDAAKCIAAADYLDDLTRRVGKAKDIAAKDVASLAACFKTAAQLRQQGAESLATAKTRYREEHRPAGPRGAALLPPQTKKLLDHAKKLTEEAERLAAESAELPAEATPAMVS